MQIDPVQEWQRLTAEYREKCDGELLELARDYADLTQSAQQALSSEVRSRGLGDPEKPKSVTAFRSARGEPTQAPLALRNAPSYPEDDIASGGAFGARAPEIVPDTPDASDEDVGSHEYTWKTFLCECETSDQAQQLSEALEQAGIDNWIEHPGTPRGRGATLAYPRVIVAADQLEQARAIAANPIPQDVIDESKEEVPEYVPPRCPKCGAEDPTLESAEPTNHWHCETCDAEWDDPLPEATGPVQSQ